MSPNGFAFKEQFVRVDPAYLATLEEIRDQLTEYVELLAGENATDLVEIQTTYHHLNRMLGNEE